MGKAIAVVAIKGGVGKSAVTQNFANIYSLFEPTIAIDFDENPKLHNRFKVRINFKDICYLNGGRNNWVVKPNILDFQKDYEKNETLIETEINKLEQNLEFKKLKKPNLKKMAIKNIGDINLLNYTTWIDDSSDFGIIGGGNSLDTESYKALSVNSGLIKQLDKLKSKPWNIFYDTEAGANNFTFKLMDNADKIILISTLDPESHEDALNMCPKFLWYKFEKFLSKEKKNTTELLNILNMASINGTNYKTIDTDIKKNLTGISDEKIKDRFNWYASGLESIKKETSFYFLINMVPKGEKIEINGKNEAAENVLEKYSLDLENVFTENGVKNYRLGSLSLDNKFKLKSSSIGVIPRLDFKRSLLSRIVNPISPFYKECYGIVKKIREGRMEEK